MRLFRGKLFLGSGEHSERGVKVLHARLDDALSHLSGLQQSHQGEEDLDFQAQVEIEEVVRDIASALLGREVHFGDVQPYPSNDGEGHQVYLQAKKNRARRLV